MLNFQLQIDIENDKNLAENTRKAPQFRKVELANRTHERLWLKTEPRRAFHPSDR